MITAQTTASDLATRLTRRATALAARRARRIAAHQRAASWRDPFALWPGFVATDLAQD
jgi:hypothetical protein